MGTTQNPHRCPAPYCRQPVRRLRFACRAHWAALPLALRDAIIKAGRRDEQHLRKRHSEEYEQATRDALSWYVTNGISGAALTELKHIDPDTQKELDEMARTRHLAEAGASRLPAGSK